MATLKNNIAEVRKRIARACQKSAVDPRSVELLAVSKAQDADSVRSAYNLGLRRFGENYLQEALEKQARLSDLKIEWHFIGPIQSNKTRPIAESFSWVQSLDRTKIAQRLNDQRPDSLGPLNCCIQVNIDDEASKAGCSTQTLPELAAAIAKLPRLRLRGLMAIPQMRGNPSHQRQSFARMRELYTELLASFPTLDTLSMGMSSSLELAIEEGANLIRVGTAIFGPRRQDMTGKQHSTSTIMSNDRNFH